MFTRLPPLAIDDSDDELQLPKDWHSKSNKTKIESIDKPHSNYSNVGSLQPPTTPIHEVSGDNQVKLEREIDWNLLYKTTVKMDGF